MQNFVAIDFETANSYRSSICSVGIVIVKNGTVQKKIHQLIRPYPNDYSWHNIQVHGITQEDTQDAPSFPEIWNLIHPLIEDLPLIAHNKSFDESCLKAAFNHYQMDYPFYQFLCTCQAARKELPHLCNHKLPTVSAHYGFSLENHHHALADAEACAHIALHLL